jgi:hypothetical protein
MPRRGCLTGNVSCPNRILPRKIARFCLSIGLAKRRGSGNARKSDSTTGQFSPRFLIKTRPQLLKTPEPAEG